MSFLCFPPSSYLLNSNHWLETKPFWIYKYRNIYIYMSYLCLEALGMLFTAQQRLYKLSHLQGKMKA